MLKDKLIQEAKEIETSVELDSIFESVELSEDVKKNFSTVFETTVKKHAVALAESHINSIAEKADTLVEEKVAERVEEIETKLVEKANTFFEYTAKDWLEENKMAVDKTIKADLFESMFTGLKSLIIEHNVTLPEESVDVVAEMEDELQEVKAETSRLFEQLDKTTKELNEVKRTTAVEKATAQLSESQQEKVLELIEGLDYSKQFDAKLTAIVEMAKNSKSLQAKQNLNESVEVENATEINTINNDAQSLNYKVDIVESVETKTEDDIIFDQYVKASQRM